MNDRLDVIAAFADGEPVAASDLSAALAHEDARAYLIDVLALRGLVTDAKPHAPVVGGLQPAVQRRRWSPLRIAAAAALIVVGVAAGFTVGRQTAVSGGREGNGGREAGTVSAVPTAASAPAAPAPTHVFRIENGVNWNERAGGD
jgi:hypothetical protein